jgi:uncharacterized membrane protein
MSDSQVYAGATLIGTVAGMRSMTAPAIVSRLAGAAGVPVDKTGLDFLDHPLIPKVMSVLAIGEVIADKLPFIPSRIAPFPLVTRAISGATSGAVLCSAKKRSPLLGAIFGAAGAIAGSYAAYALRKRIVKSLHVPDTVVAMAEDALALGTGTMIASKLRSLSASA